MKEKCYKFLPLIMMGIYCYLTINTSIFSGRIPWEDEAHAWTIAGHTNLFQLIDLMRVEGHFLLWYLVIMPFAKFNFCYPYPMLIINWAFAVGALFIMWYKAPFNNYIKTGITFSAPFLQLYSISARCYSIGIFFLFLAMSLYKDRLNKPYKYLACLVLTANTSLPLCIASGILGIMFVHDLIKKQADKKIFYTIFGVLIFHLILFYFQFHGVSTPDYNKSDELINAPYPIVAYLGLVKITNRFLLFKIILLWIGTILYPLLLFKSKKAFTFFILSSGLNLIFFTYIYSARVHHVCLIWIFAITALWIYKTECPKLKKIDWISLFFIIAALQMILVPIGIQYGELQGLTSHILEDKTLKNVKIFTNFEPILLSVTLPYLEKENIYFYDTHNNNISSYEGLKTYFNKELKRFDVDTLYESIEDGCENYFILNEKLKKNYILGEKHKINMYLYKVITVQLQQRPRLLFIYKMSKTELPDYIEFKEESDNKDNNVLMMDIRGNVF